MFRRKKNLRNVGASRNPAETVGKPVFEESTRRLWGSRRKAAQDLGVSTNWLSKHLDGK